MISETSQRRSRRQTATAIPSKDSRASFVYPWTPCTRSESMASKPPEAKHKSLACLDLVNFFQADTQTGVGPFLAVYLLATHHWDPGKIGIAMFAQGIAVVLAQIPAGAMVDAFTTKRIMIALASLGVAAASIAIVHLDGLIMIIAAQVVVGVCS